MRRKFCLNATPWLHISLSLSLCQVKASPAPRDVTLVSGFSRPPHTPITGPSYKYNPHGPNPSSTPSPTAYIPGLPYLSPLEVWLPSQSLPPPPLSYNLTCLAEDHEKSTEESVKLRRDSAMDDNKGTVNLDEAQNVPFI